MSVHESWLASIEKYRLDLLEKFGRNLKLPPPSLQELQLEYLEIEPGKKMMGKLPFQKRFTNPMGSFQGGFLAAALDEVFGPLSYLTAQGPCMTLSMNITYLKAFHEKLEFCIVEATVVKKTTNFIFMRAEVRAPDGEIMAHAETHVTILLEQMKGTNP